MWFMRMACQCLVYPRQLNTVNGPYTHIYRPRERCIADLAFLLAPVNSEFLPAPQTHREAREILPMIQARESVELGRVWQFLDESEGGVVNKNARVQNKLSDTCPSYKLTARALKTKWPFSDPTDCFLSPLPVAVQLDSLRCRAHTARCCDVWNLAADSLTLATITSHLCDCNNSRGVFLEHVLH